LLSDLLESGFNPHISSHGLSGAELTRLPLNAPTPNPKSNCNAKKDAAGHRQRSPPWSSPFYPAFK
jgi:hypothetical protein